METFAPSYQAASLQGLFERRSIPGSANPGLVFDRFMRLWTRDPRSGAPKRVANENRSTLLTDALTQFIGDYQGLEPIMQPELDALHSRFDRAQAASPGLLEARRYRTVSRLAVGLGADHPLENSLTFDHSLGAAVVPGSAVKGLCRAAAELLALTPERLLELFGHDAMDTARPEVAGVGCDGGVEPRTGDLLFYPAFPERWPRLELDVINNHHPEYYAAPAERHPHGLESPVPVFFLTVAPQSPFVFRLGSRAARKGRTDEARANLELGFALLRVGLESLGLGSKTAVGYGRWQGG